MSHDRSDRVGRYDLVSPLRPCKDEIVAKLRDLQAEVMIIFLPVGSQKAVEFYAECALEAGVAVVNGIPVFIASHPVWAEKFRAAGVPTDITEAVRAACADIAAERVAVLGLLVDLLLRVVGAEHLLKLLPAGTHEYEKFIKPSELAAWIRAAGLQMREMTGLVYNPITRRYRLNERDVSVNYMLRAVKPS